MEKNSSKIICEDCKIILNSINEICTCGSYSKVVIMDFSDGLESVDAITTNKKNPKLTGKRKILEKYFDGFSMSANRSVAYKRQIIDVENNYYYEIVINDKGNLLRFCEEPLKHHIDRRSAKFKK